jgi:extracellular factor (EF) 3-hydroxypalmitic acid methyl ester biosynthesis protein
MSIIKLLKKGLWAIVCLYCKTINYTIKQIFMKVNNVLFEKKVAWINNFVNQPAHSVDEWTEYYEVAQSLGNCFRNNELGDAEKLQLKAAYGSVLTAQTLQGYVLEKPHGYAGDYEIIDKFYTYHRSPDERLAKWDEYVHEFKAVKAVRNRKTYIIQNLAKKMAYHTSASPFEMLNLASGPARDIFEFFAAHPFADLNVDCIDLDENAIKYATSLLGEFSSRVNFLNKNILRFTTTKKYDLVWSAGLFDYFNDDVFKRLLTRFLGNVKTGGELIVGNFCSTNPDINYMELLDWKLYHRSTEDLIQLAMECGISRKQISVDKEPEGVNLFIRIKM